MDQPVNHYWQLRLHTLQENLIKNHFDAYLADDGDAARKLVLEQLLPQFNIRNISFGGSMTLTGSGLYAALTAQTRWPVIDTFEKEITLEAKHERRRQALLADLFITGTNAITERGQLVNLDMIGNRVAALTFGPRVVIILVGRNKVVSDLPAAMTRIKHYTAPANALRLDKRTPCAQTGCCQECNGPDRICNHWTITEKSFPKGRIKVVLINQDLGL
jgi:L-lactate utilization protein LutB